jgi:hypothetical protein
MVAERVDRAFLGSREQVGEAIRLSRAESRSAGGDLLLHARPVSKFLVIDRIGSPMRSENLTCLLVAGLLPMPCDGCVAAAGRAEVPISAAEAPVRCSGSAWSGGCAEEAEPTAPLILASPPRRPGDVGSSPQRGDDPGRAAPHGFWRTIAPTIVRSEASGASLEVAGLPVGAKLRPLEIGETWSRVRGRAGAIEYEGYVPTRSITRADR